MSAYPPIVLEVLRLTLWLVILSLVFVPLERLCAVRPQRIFRQGIATDLGYYFLNSLLPAVLLAPPLALVAAAVLRVLPDGYLQWVGTLPFGIRAAVAFVAGEVGYYWGHRLSHVVPFLWRMHAVHHSAEAMDFLVSTRAHPADMVFGRLCALTPVYALGLASPASLKDGTVPVAVTLLATVWGFFIHANLRWRLGPLERVVTTPMFHHWHHTRSGPIDRNFASNLAALDWLFGSLHLPGAWPPDYGISEPMPEHLVDQLVHPFFPEPAAAAPAPDPALAAAGVADPRAAEEPADRD